VYSHVSKILRVYSSDEGCTQPAVVLLDDERQAVFKYPQNPMGIIVLFNEYIAYCIAKAIGLCAPEFGVANVDESTQLDEKTSELYSLTRFMGTGFYSAYIPKSVPVSLKILKHASNLNETGKIILLDQIVKNSDRYSENMRLELTSASPKMYIIDHSHALGDPDWDTTTLMLHDCKSPYIWRENLTLYTMLINAGAIVTPDTLRADCEFIQAQITEESIENIFSSVPAIWRMQIGEFNVKHAQRYILDRIKNLQTICQTINEERGV